MSNGFPGLTQLDELRYQLYTTSHEDVPLAKAVGTWLGHKILSVACLPCDIAAVGVGAIGMVATAATLGSLKVAIFAGSLGNIKPTFSIGFLWLGERTITSGMDGFSNVWELVYDAANLLYQGWRLVRWVAEKIHLGDFLSIALRAIGDFFEMIGREVLMPVLELVARRLEAGIEKANESERDFKYTGEAPFFIRPLNDLTTENRIDWNCSERHVSTILQHYALSIANIPLNALTAACSAIAVVILSSAYVGKVSLYAATNLNIPVPTFSREVFQASCTTTYNVLADTGTDIGDVFVLIYKTGCALRINRIMATALDVLMYIPMAVFS